MTRDRKNPPANLLAADLESEEQAIRLAEKLAARLGKAIVVSDANGQTIWIAEPEVKNLQ